MTILAGVVKGQPIIVSDIINLGSVGLCRYNFEHKCYLCSLRQNADIILIFLQHNAVVFKTVRSERKFSQKLALECTKLIKARIF